MPDGKVKKSSKQLSKCEEKTSTKSEIQLICGFKNYLITKVVNKNIKKPGGSTK